jgi:hypothetical protein
MGEGNLFVFKHCDDHALPEASAQETFLPNKVDTSSDSYQSSADLLAR